MFLDDFITYLQLIVSMVSTNVIPLIYIVCIQTSLLENVQRLQ